MYTYSLGSSVHPVLIGHANYVYVQPGTRAWWVAGRGGAGRHGEGEEKACPISTGVKDAACPIGGGGGWRNGGSAE